MNANNSENPVDFEQALCELQDIVSQLEEGQHGLEESLRQYERGIRLYRLCSEYLSRAEQRIQIVTGTDAEGNPTTAPFDASATFAQSEQPIGKRRPQRSSEPPADDGEEKSLF